MEVVVALVMGALDRVDQDQLVPALPVFLPQADLVAVEAGLGLLAGLGPMLRGEGDGDHVAGAGPREVRHQHQGQLAGAVFEVHAPLRLAAGLLLSRPLPGAVVPAAAGVEHLLAVRARLNDLLCLCHGLTSMSDRRLSGLRP